MSNPYAPPGSRPPGVPPDRPAAPTEGHDPASSAEPVPRPSPASPDHRPDGPQHLPRRPGARPPAEPAQVATALRTCGYFALLVLAGLLVLPLGLPWQVSSLGFFGVGAVYGVRALVRVVRAGVRQGVVAALVLGLVATALLVLAEGSQVAAWRVTAADQRCREQALTIAAGQACTENTRTALADLLDPQP